MESRSGMIFTDEKGKTREKPVPEPLLSPKVPHGLTWVR
jgi:hypothetical protein